MKLIREEIISVVLPVMAVVIPTAHAVECEAGGVRSLCQSRWRRPRLMIKKGKVPVIGVLTAVGFVGWLLSSAAAAVRIEGQVQAAGGAVAGSTVSLWAASAEAPARLAQTNSDADGRFIVSVEQTPAGASILYLVAAGGTPSINKQGGNNPAIAFLAVLGGQPPDKVVVNELTTLASVVTTTQFLDGTAIKGSPLALRIAAGDPDALNRVGRVMVPVLAAQKPGWEGGSLTVFGPDGTEASFSPVYGKGIYAPWAVSVDGNDNIWISNLSNASAGIVELCGFRTENCPAGLKTGDAISPPGGYVGGGLQMQVDVGIGPAGDVWVTNNWQYYPAPLGKVDEALSTLGGGQGVVVFFGMAKPVRTPLIGPPRAP
jgi:hypothetical protein